MANRKEMARFLCASDEYRPSLLRLAVGLTNGDGEGAKELVASVMTNLWDEINQLEDGDIGSWLIETLRDRVAQRQRIDQNSPESLVQGEWLTILQLSRRLGKSERWVSGRTSELSMRGEVRVLARCGRLGVVYPPAALTELEQMLPTNLPAGDCLPMSQLYQQVGRSRLWISNRLQKMGRKGQLRINRANRVSLHWPGWVLPVLKTLAVEYPDSGDWLSLAQLAVALGKDREWIEPRLVSVGGEARRIPGSGKIFIHYPPGTVEALRAEAEKLVPAGGWMTAPQIASRVGRSRNWVKRRVDGEPFEMRISANGRPEPHYPPEVITELVIRYNEDDRGHNRGTVNPLLD